MISVKSFTERRFGSGNEWKEDVEVKEKPLLLPILRVVVFPDGKITGIRGPGVFRVYRFTKNMKEGEIIGIMELNEGLHEWKMTPNTAVSASLNGPKHFGVTWVA